MVAEEHNEPETNGAGAEANGADALQADDADNASVGNEPDTDAQSTATGVTETQEMGRVSPQRGWRPSEMNNVQLCNWMEQMGASKETLEELLRSGTDGSELMFCMDTGQQTNENIEMVERQLKLAGDTLLCMRLRQRLTSEAEAERQERDQSRRIDENQANKAETTTTRPRESFRPKNKRSSEPRILRHQRRN